jgi:hypothetical protein
MRTDLLVISGKQGSGKTTLVNAYLQEFHSPAHDEKVVEVRFAGPIYAIHDRARALVRSLGIECPEKSGGLLQYLGTEWGRKTLGDDVWVKCARAQVERIQADSKADGVKHLTVIISDCRFRNEFAEFPDALRVRLEGDRDVRKARAEGWRDTEDHISETDLDLTAMNGEFDLRFWTDSDSMKPLMMVRLIREHFDRGTYRVDRMRR